MLRQQKGEKDAWESWCQVERLEATQLEINKIRVGSDKSVEMRLKLHSKFLVIRSESEVGILRSTLKAGKTAEVGDIHPECGEQWLDPLFVRSSML
jgi:hypothetical protein